MKNGKTFKSITESEQKCSRWTQSNAKLLNLKYLLAANEKGYTIHDNIYHFLTTILL